MRTGRKIGWTACIAGMLAFVGICGYLLASGAVFDESKAVKYRDYVSSHRIEDSMLFVGTYLIHVQALTDELYEKAQDSAADSGQMQVYYKSELAGGAWFDITDASGLQEITEEGVIVTEDALAELWVTCCTGADGITKSAVDGQEINIFDTPDPYDLYNLPELEPIRIQYDNVFSSDSTGVDKYYYDKLKDFFEIDVKTDITNECDTRLSALQSAYARLQKADKKELAEIVSRLMGKVDARRRAEVLSRLSQIEDNELDLLQKTCSGSGYNGDDYDGEQFVENSSVMDAVGTAMQSCQESFITHSGNQLDRGTTVLKNAEYDTSMRIVSGAAGNIDADLEKLNHIYHIEDDVVADAKGELAVLEGQLIAAGEAKYKNKLTEGAGPAYRAAQANNISQSAKNQVLEDQKADVNAARMELQYLIEAKTKRQDAAEATAFLYEKINGLDTLRNGIAADDFQNKASETVDEYGIWIQDLAGKLAGENEELMSEMQKLEKEKEDLLDKKAEALDANDLSLAKKYDAAIEETDKKIAAKEKELMTVMANPASSAAEKAQAANQSGSSTALNRINQLKNDALSIIADGGGVDEVSGILDSLSALGAEDAIAEILEKAKASGNSDLVKKTEQAMTDSRDSSLHDLYGTGGGGAETGIEGGTGTGSGTVTGSGAGAGTGSGAGSGSGTGTGSGAGSGTGTGSGSGSGSVTGSGAGTGTGTGDETGSGMGSGAGAGSGSGTGTGSGSEAAGTTTGIKGTEGLKAAGISSADIENAVEELYGKSFDQLSDKDKATVMAALNRLGEAGSKDAANLSRAYAERLSRENNPFLYRKLEGQSEHYLAVKTIGSACGYRYVYSDSRQEATLSKKSNVFRFRNAGKEAVLSDGSKKKLKQPVLMQKLLYLSESDALSMFDCCAEYIQASDYAVCLSAQMDKKAAEFCRTFQEGGN